MFPHRKPSLKARNAMRDAAFELDERAPKDKKIREAEEEISKVTTHDKVQFVSSGNCAIFAVANTVDGKIMIPDQGAWRGFKDYPTFLGKEVCYTKTDFGIIEPETLESEIRKQSPAALFVASLAGYIAEQKIVEIAKVCRENNVLLVEDASGAIGHKELARGTADIIVCSTGSPKVLNLLSGGFISTNKAEILEKSKEIIAACKIDPIVCAGIIEELKDANKRIQKLTEYSEILKEYLKRVVHRDSKGICVGFETENPKRFASDARKMGLVTDIGKSFLTTCPRYERFLKKGIVVELKNLEVFEMSEEDVGKIGETLKKL